MSESKRILFLAMLVSLGTALYLIESLLLLPLPIPGIKLGLANIVTVLAIYTYGYRDGLLVALLRVLLGSLISGMFMSPGFMLAMSGSLLSALVIAMAIKNSSCFSMIGISILGAVAHNTGQIIAAAILLKTASIIYYLPILLITAIPTGFITGYLLNSLISNRDFSAILNRFRC